MNETGSRVTAETGFGGLVRWTVLLLTGFLLVNGLLFATYRLLFLESFVTGAAEPGAKIRVLLYGFRLDAALLGAQACVVGVLFLVLLSARLRMAFGWLWFWTYLNALFCFADLEFYREGNRHLGPVLLTRVTNLHEIATELRSFFVTNLLAPLALLALTVAWFWVGRRVKRRLPPRRWNLVRPWWRIAVAALAAFMLLLPLKEPVTSKKARGWSVEWVTSRHYLRLNNYMLHEAIPNPLHETLFAHLPLLFLDVPEARLSEEAALGVCRERLAGKAPDDRYPLRTTLSSPLDLGIRNILIIQVEGLSASVLERREGAEWVMPCLRRLAREGIYYPNTIQGFNNTAGGVFCTATSLPRTCLGERKTRLYTASEIGGYYGSLPRILDEDGREHLFFAAYRQSHFDYTAFMGNQGFTTLGYPDFHRIIEERGEAEGAESVLGVYDGPFLLECARILRSMTGTFTAHAMTASTHSPWTVPEGFSAPFEDRRLVAFRYLDSSIERCLALLAREPGLLDETLVVVVADHTGISFTDTWLDRMRVPLIFYNPRFAERGLAGRREAYAGHADIVPTALALVGGSHPYAGLGRNLLAPDIPEGVISGTRYGGYYFLGDHVLEWRLYPETVRLLGLVDGVLGDRDLSEERPVLFRRMHDEFFGQYETARRLSLDRRVFPR